MAIFHLSARVVQRSKNRSVVAKAAYNGRTTLRDERKKETHDYTDTEGLVSSGIYIDPRLKAPEWMYDRAKLVNGIEKDEKSEKAQLAREIIIALPSNEDGFDNEWRRRLVNDFVREQFMQHGMIAIVDIHEPDKEGDQRNYHAHIILTMREIGWKDFTIRDQDGEVYRLSKIIGSRAENLQEFMKKGVNRDALPEFVTLKEKRAKGRARAVKDEVKELLSESVDGADFRKKLEANGFTLGNLGAKGFGLKNREWNTVKALDGWRASWERLQNRYLARRAPPGTPPVSRHTLEKQGITDRAPTRHLGPIGTAKKRREEAELLEQLPFENAVQDTQPRAAKDAAKTAFRESFADAAEDRTKTKRQADTVRKKTKTDFKKSGGETTKRRYSQFQPTPWKPIPGAAPPAPPSSPIPLIPPTSGSRPWRRRPKPPDTG